MESKDKGFLLLENCFLGLVNDLGRDKELVSTACTQITSLCIGPTNL